jgi:hypothetical protein
MKIPKNEIVVLDIAGAHARVICGNPAVETKLFALGFNFEQDQLVRAISDAEDRKNLVNSLIRLGAIFAGGRDWSPADLVDYYREQGTISTSYRTITWTSPEKYVIVDR